MLIGALSALYLRSPKENNTESSGGDLFAFIGIALVLFPVFIYDSETDFPGLAAVPPVFGTAMLIIFANQNTLVGKILSQRMLVGIGLISYSAYLWHQPLFAFSRYFAYHLSTPTVIIITMSTFILAYLSWRCIESPFRDRSRFSVSKIWKLVGFFSLLFVVIGVFLVAKKETSNYQFSETG